MDSAAVGRQPLLLSLAAEAVVPVDSLAVADRRIPVGWAGEECGGRDLTAHAEAQGSHVVAAVVAVGSGGNAAG